MALIRQGTGYNYVNPGDEPILAGTGILNNALFGVASARIEPGELGLIETQGTWSFDVAEDVTAEQGAEAFWDPETSTVAAAAGTGGVSIGYFAEKCEAGDGVAKVLLTGLTLNDAQSGLMNDEEDVEDEEDGN